MGPKRRQNSIFSGTLFPLNHGYGRKGILRMIGSPFPAFSKEMTSVSPGEEKSLGRCGALVPAATLLVHLAPRPCLACHRRRDVAQSRWLGGESDDLPKCHVLTGKVGLESGRYKGERIHKTTPENFPNKNLHNFFFLLQGFQLMRTDGIQFFKCPTLQPPRLLGMARRGPWHMWTAWRRFVAARRRCMEHGAEVPNPWVFSVKNGVVNLQEVRYLSNASPFSTEPMDSWEKE